MRDYMSWEDTTPRKKVQNRRFFDGVPDRIFNDIDDIPEVRKPNQDKKEIPVMKKVWKKVKRFAGLAGGVITGGGSLLAGVDLTNALLIAGCTIALIVGVEVATIKEFKDIFGEDEK